MMFSEKIFAGAEDVTAAGGAAVCRVAVACRGCDVLLPWGQAVTRVMGEI